MPEKQPSTSSSASNKGKAIAAATKSQQQRNTRPSAYSSDDDTVPVKSQTNPQPTKKPVADAKKKPIAAQIIKAKTAASNSVSVPPSTGGKAPPAVVKQQQQQMHNLNKSLVSKSNVGAAKAASKPTPANSTQAVKPTPAAATLANAESKKKSIFSPDNSTESEDDDATIKKAPQKSSNAPKAKQQPSQPPAARPKGRPPIHNSRSSVKVQDKRTSKSSAESSAGSTSQTETTTTSDTESESSADSSPPITKKSINKKGVPQVKSAPSSASKSESKDNGNSDSDAENKQTPNVMRKLTRSSSTRKSKHLTGNILYAHLLFHLNYFGFILAIFNPGKASETESESESKRSLSKSPVKRAPGTKGKSKSNSKTNAKQTNSSPVKKTTPTVPEERRCPVDGCDSNGHLGGHLDKHFTQEACPIYHNMTLTDTNAWASERAQRQEERKKALILYEPNKKSVTVEQKAYQLKVKDIRSKFKPNPPSPTIPNTRPHPIMSTMHKDREPTLTGLVSDYDLQLFREAQALASEKIEEEVKDIPVGKGTKYILMGRHTMEVWYQSPYPDDAARLPKLYLCEFCLRYQKSEVGMKRHAAKCVWRHPPGDEVSRNVFREKFNFFSLKST